LNQTKLIQALQIITPSEWLQLKKFVKMEVSEGSDVYLIYDCTSKIVRSQSQIPDKEDFRVQHFPNMSMKSFLNLCSKLYQIIEKWLVYNNTINDQDKTDVLLVKTFNRRGQYALADKTFNKAKKRLTNQNQFSLSKHHSLYELYRYHYFSENPVKNNNGKEFLEDFAINFIKSFNETSEILLTELISWGNYKNYDYSNTIFLLESSQDIFSRLEVNPITNKILGLRKNESIELLEALISALENGKIKSGSDLEVFAVMYSLSIAIALWRKSKLPKVYLLLKTLNLGLSLGILTTMGKLSEVKFLNFVSILILTSKPYEVERFVDKWAHLLSEETRESSILLAKCYIKRKEEKYNDILLLLRSTNNLNIKEDTRMLSFQIMALYKLNEFDQVKIAINNFKRRLRYNKNKIGKNIYTSKVNFLKATELLIKSKFTKEKVDLSKFKYLHHKIWLSEQENVL